MTILERATAIGVFTEHAAADVALKELHEAGFAADQLGFVVLDHDAAERFTIPAGASELTSAQGTATGAMGGGLIGGIAGAACALLIPGFGPALAGGMLLATLGGLAMGAVVGGFAGSLAILGVPQEEANHYQDLLTSGHTIVTVQAPGRYEEALEILRRHGAANSAVSESATAATSPAAQQSAPPSTLPTEAAVSSTSSTAHTPPVPSMTNK